MAEISVTTGILRLFRIRQALHHDQNLLTLWELLTLKRFGMLSTDNRDFIYALLGISNDAAEKHLYPDYTKDAVEVYTAVAKRFLADGVLRTLWLCAHSRRLNGLPSWVPDWSSTWQTDRRYLSTDAGYGTGSRIFCAAGQTRPSVSFSSKNGRMVLHLEGFIVDIVSTTKSAFKMELDLKEGGLLRARHTLQTHFRQFWNLQQNQDATLRTGIADIEHVWGPNLTFTYRRSTRRMRRQLWDSLFSAAHSESGLETGTLNLPTSHVDILFRHNGRRPFITSGDHLGLGPAKLQSGDLVVIAYGSEVPLILRPENGHYKFVGEAYVDGIMDGQALAMGLEERTFDIT